jgi:hypothetical protein
MKISVEHIMLSSPADTQNMAVMRSSDTEVIEVPQCIKGKTIS